MEKTELAFGKIPSYRKYELFMERYRSAADEFINPFIKEKQALGEPVKILDVGAGEGYLKYFIESQEPIQMDGIEIDSRRIEICKDLGYKIWSLDLEKDKLPFKTDSYDIVVASHVLEHLYNPQPCMDEIYRVLKPKGLAVIGLPMHPHWVSKLLQLKEKFFPAARHSHHQFFSMKSLRQFLKKYPVRDIRGFRLLSARKRFAWENHYAFYRWNTWWGRRFPNLTPEINAIIEKN